MNSMLTFEEMLLRILAAAVAGAMVGVERENHGRPAGLRTTILVCVASAVAMILSEILFFNSSGTVGGGNWRPDPARLGAGILTGIGFLGAGTILRHHNVILGVTTAASLWFVTVLGLALGAGEFLLGAMGVGVAMVTLMFLPALEKHIPSDYYGTLAVTMALEAMTDHELRDRLQTLAVKVIRMELVYDIAARQKTVSCDLKLERRTALDVSARIIATLRQCPGVLHIKWS